MRVHVDGSGLGLSIVKALTAKYGGAAPNNAEAGAAVAACALVVLAGLRFRNTCTPVVSPKQAPQRVQAIAGPTPQ